MTSRRWLQARKELFDAEVLLMKAQSQLAQESESVDVLRAQVQRLRSLRFLTLCSSVSGCLRLFSLFFLCQFLPGFGCSIRCCAALTGGQAPSTRRVQLAVERKLRNLLEYDKQEAEEIAALSQGLCSGAILPP